jgi:hypothetical protein
MLEGLRGNESFYSIPRTSEAERLTSGVACNRIYLGNQRKNANNAMAAALMMSAQIHPSRRFTATSSLPTLFPVNE